MDAAPAGRRLGDIFCASALLALALFILLYGLRYPMFKDGVVGPGLMPLIASLALAAASATVLWKILRPSVPIAQIPAGPKEPGLSLGDFSEDEPEAAGKPTTVAGILGMLALSTLLAPVVGLIPMMGVLVFVCVYVFERQSLTIALVLAIGAAVVSWLLFVQLFEITVPVGSVWQGLVS